MKIFYLIIIIYIFASCSPSVKKQKGECEQSSIKVSKETYQLIEKKEIIVNKNNYFIASILLKSKKNGKLVELWKVATAICKENNYIGADFFVRNEYGKNIRKEKFKWKDSLLLKKSFVGTVNAIHHGKNWKEKICRKDFSSPFQF